MCGGVGVALLSLVLACTPTFPEKAAATEPSDSELLVYTLLHLDHPAFSSAGGFNALAQYQAWADLYARTRDEALAPSADSPELSRFLLAGFVADARLDAGTSEAFTADLMPVYLTRGDAVLGVMRDSPFLEPSACHHLGAFFGFEDRNAGGAESFIAENQARIEGALGVEQGRDCIAAIRAGGVAP